MDTRHLGPERAWYTSAIATRKPRRRGTHSRAPEQVCMTRFPQKDQSHLDGISEQDTRLRRKLTGEAVIMRPSVTGQAQASPLRLSRDSPREVHADSARSLLVTSSVIPSSSPFLQQERFQLRGSWEKNNQLPRCKCLHNVCFIDMMEFTANNRERL